MNRRLVLLLSTLGPAMGALSVLGAFGALGERVAWTVVTFVCAVVIARARAANAFWHGVVTGFVVGASATLVQGLFATAYITNNPWVVERFADQPEGFDLRMFILMLVPFIGLASALLTGFVSWLVDRALSGRAASGEES